MLDKNDIINGKLVNIYYPVLPTCHKHHNGRVYFSGIVVCQLSVSTDYVHVMGQTHSNHFWCFFSIVTKIFWTLGIIHRNVRHSEMVFTIYFSIQVNFTRKLYVPPLPTVYMVTKLTGLIGLFAHSIVAALLESVREYLNSRHWLRIPRSTAKTLPPDSSQ